MSNYFNRKDIIYKVYQERSISKAAQKLFVSQPSLSVMIQRIEEEVGVPLFDRTSKPIGLTEAGKEYIKATEEIMHTEKAFENYLQACRDLQTGSLTIGSNQLLSSLVLPRYIGQFLAKYPKIHLNLVDDNSIVLENMATAGQLDLVLDNHPLDRNIFEQHIIRREHLLLAVPSHFSCNNGMERFQLSAQDIKAGRHIGEAGQCVPLQNFADIDQVTKDTGKKFDFILADLGVSSMQIDNPERGFSYKVEGPLDLRMNPQKGTSAAERLQEVTEEELIGMFVENADEPYAEEIAATIMKWQKNGKAIETTTQMREVTEQALCYVPKAERVEAVKKSCARVFQALRIEVNGELKDLKKAIFDAVDILNNGGRLCIITFHSLEDRIVKSKFNDYARACTCPPNFPVCVCGKESKGRVVTRKPVLPSEEELKANSRSKSAKLRVFARSI